MTRRREFVLAAASAALPLSSRAAEAPGRRRRLGALLFDDAASWRFLEDEIRKALADLGWIEGSNLGSEWRYADGDAGRLPKMAAALVASGVDAILTRGTPATRALQQATRRVPIVTGVGDPVGAGFAASLARPGGNITGLSYAEVETSQKRVQLLREVRPRLARLTVILLANRRTFVGHLGAMEAVTRAAGVEPRVVLVTTLDDVRTALRSAGSGETDAAFSFGLGTGIDPLELARLVRESGVPTMFEYPFYVEAGGLMSYRLDFEDQSQRTAAHLDKVFRGMSPAQIPFEFPTVSDLVINTGAARALGLTLPRSLLVRANRIVA
jgi:putative ABC transport system substrate-binding protein